MNQFRFFVIRRRCGSVYDELRTQLANVLSRLTPLNDLRSDASFVLPYLPACVLSPARLCDFVFFPDFMLFLHCVRKIRSLSDVLLSRPTAIDSSRECTDAPDVLAIPKWGELPFAMLEKLHLPQPFLRGCKSLIGTAEVLTLARKHLIAIFDFLNHFDLPLRQPPEIRSTS